MSNPSQSIAAAAFSCPACRAKQPLQPACRRCQADLSLLVAATQRAIYLERELSQDGLTEDHKQRLQRELKLLAP